MPLFDLKETNMNCQNKCRICPRLIISDSVTVVTIAGTDTLVIDLPAPTLASVPYVNHCQYCVVVAQTVPVTATVNMPVAFSIAGDTTTVYPFLNCDCSPVTACGIQSRTKYPVVINTTVDGGVFKSLRKLNCYRVDTLATLPAPAATAAVATFATPGRVTTTTTTKVVKEVK